MSLQVWPTLASCMMEAVTPTASKQVKRECSKSGVNGCTPGQLSS